MHRIHILLFPALAVLVLASCASAPSAPPAWVERGVEAEYPPDAYIAVQGRGATRKEAETDAMAALTRYLSSRVSTAARSSSMFSSTGGNSKRLESSVIVESELRFSNVRCAAPYYDGRAKEYISAAYLNRSEAWESYRPRAQKEIDGFRALYRTAESETVPLKEFFDYRTARRFAGRDEFQTCIALGEVLHPANMASLTAGLSRELNTLDDKINSARSRSSIVVECGSDFEALISTTLTRILSAQGLMVTGNAQGASAVCAATVEEGYQRREGAGDFYYPAIRITLSGRQGGVLFSYSAEGGKQAAVTPDVAKRRAYAALAACLEKTFAEELNRKFE